MNTVFLLGHLGKGVELKKSQSDTSFCNFSLATSRQYKDNNGNKVEQTEWHNIVCFGKLAELCGKYIQRGSKVLVEGSIRQESYDKDGERRYSTKIMAKNVIFLDAKKKEGDPHSATQRVTQECPGHTADVDVPF